MDPKIIEKIPVSLSEVKNELNRIKKRDDELSFRGNKTEEYINSVHTVSEKVAKEIFGAIEKLKVLRMKAEHIIKLIDLMPKTEAEVKYIVGSMALTVSKENVTKIFKIIKEHIPKVKK
jgi:DNA-directed RNA polymerase subunit F